MNYIFIDKVLSVFQKNIIPLTEKGVLLGNKIFGAAILNKIDYSLVCIGTNNELENPLWHGEISVLNKNSLLKNFLVRTADKGLIF